MTGEQWWLCTYPDCQYATWGHESGGRGLEPCPKHPNYTLEAAR